MLALELSCGRGSSVSISLSLLCNRDNATLGYNVEIVVQIVKAIRVNKKLIYCFQCLLTVFTFRLFLGDEITFSSPTF